MNSIKTPLEMFYRWEKECPEQVFLRQSLGNQQWREYTWGQFADRVRRLANFIVRMQLPAASNIAIWSSNSADWVVADLAIMLSGHVSVPLYAGQDADSARYILRQSDCRLAFLGEFDGAAQFTDIRPQQIITVAMHGNTIERDFDIEQIIAAVAPFLPSPVPDPEALMTIVYSSGTSGNPKGVMHSHGTPGKVLPIILDAVGAAVARADFDGERARLFAFLSMSHIAERAAVELAAIYCNGLLSVSAGLTSFADEMRSVQPTVFFAVPRLWAKFKAAVDAQIPAAAQASFTETDKQAVRRQLGLDQCRCVISGAAPIPVDIQRWFLDLGIALREAYSMTESFLQGAMWQSEQPPVPGCVGTPSAGLQINISADGEICFKMPAPMQGYYKEPEKTAQVMADGWYRTGDSGYIDTEGNLWVTGRLGDMFKTSKGKFIHPTAIEDKFGAVKELGQLLVFGHGRHQPLLLTNLSEFGKTQSRQQLQDYLQGALAAINEQLPAYQRVAQMFIAADEWTMDSGLVTPTMKLKRRHIENHYRDWVQQHIETQTVVWQ